MRIGSSQLPHTHRQTGWLTIQSCCFQAITYGHGVVRIPHHVIDASVSAHVAQLAPLIHAHQLRCVVHAPLSDFASIEHWLRLCGQCLDALDPVGGTIVCHLMRNDAATRHWMQHRLPDIATTIAIEHTHQPLSELLAFAETYALPVVFDLLHYHTQMPWPYDAAHAAQQCHDTWHEQRPLMHISSQATMQRHHRPGAHSEMLDSAQVCTFLRQLYAKNPCEFDIEIEAQQSFGACQELLQVIAQRAPDLQQRLEQPRGRSHGSSYR